MKKRIIAILLCVSIALSTTFGLHKKAEAAVTGTVVAIAAIGTFAFSVLMLITSGEAERIADDVYYWIEYTAKPGFENCFIGDGSSLAVGYNQIFQTVNGWFESGELEIVDGQIILTYAQYHELYGKVFTVMSRPSVDFHSDYYYTFYEVEFPFSMDFESFPLNSDYVYSSRGQSYSPIYYDDERIIFSPYWFSIRCETDGFTTPSISSFYLDENYGEYGMFHYHRAANYSTISEFSAAFRFLFKFLDINNICQQYLLLGEPYEQNKKFDYVYVYENGMLDCKSIADFDLSKMSSGFVSTSGDYPGFLKSLDGYTISLTKPDNLDDLSGTLPTDYNPTLKFPSVPDSNIPLQNQIIVGNVPGFADLPLSEYQAELDTDIDIPSVIINKFPFCIPFDFIRIISVLCADPVAPVFRIPISTSPENLEGWEGNQTIGEYLNPDELLFEIDEEVIIDLSVIPLLQPICYTCFIVGFVLLLIHITPKMIQH